MEDQQPLLILYASVTGNAKYCAKQIYRECAMRHVNAYLAAFDEYDIRKLPAVKYAVFVVATTGDGDPPPNMMKSWKFLLRSDLGASPLKDLKFSIFGLGDSAYQHFNAMARKLYQRLLSLGATVFQERALGDDQHDFGYEGQFDPWLSQIWISLKRTPLGAHLTDSSVTNDLDFEFPSNLEIEFLSTEKSSFEQYLELLPTPLESINQREVVLATVLQNKRITAHDHQQDVRYLSLKIPEDLVYQAGDVCAIHPQNDSELTSKFITFLGYSPSQLVLLSQPKTPSHAPDTLVLPYNKPISLQSLFSTWVDFLGVPTRSFPRSLLKYTQNEVHLRKLKQFCQKSKEGKSQFYRYVVREKRTFFEFLYDFSSIQIPLNKLIPLIGNLRYREYSIASAPTLNPTEVQLCAAVLKYQTPLERKKVGVCSAWIQNELIQGAKVAIWIKRGTLKLFKSPEKKFSYIFVGPGTGVAPLRSLIWELRDDDTPVTLFFGNRYRAKDYHYSGQWELLKKQKKSFRVIEAWSREEEHKVYVHHKIKENAELIKEIFENAQGRISVIFVCGRAKNMPRAVQNAFAGIVGEATIEQMKKHGCYKVEAW